MDPFAVTGGSRIPDGGAMASLPLTHRVVQEINMPAVQENEPGDGIGHIVIYPGLQAGLYWTQDPTGGANEVDHHFKYNSDISWTGQITDVGKLVNDSYGSLKLTGNVSRWRCVSQALRLTLLNTDDQNDGWFEACRMSYKPKLDDWKIRANKWRRVTDSFGVNLEMLEGDGVKDQNVFVIDDKLVDDWESRNLAEANSYIAGSLKDIEKYQFNLMPFSKNNEFINNDSFYEVQGALKQKTDMPGIDTPTGPGDPGFEPTTTDVDFVTGSTGGKQMYEAAIDHNHDFVFIKIHPGANGTKLLAELATNQEVVYDVDSELNKHMTPTDNMKATFEKAQALKHAVNQSAAVAIA